MSPSKMDRAKEHYFLYIFCPSRCPEDFPPLGQPREDSLALLVKDIRERVEELMVQVGSTDADGLVDLKHMAQKFKASKPQRIEKSAYLHHRREESGRGNFQPQLVP